MPTAPEVEDHTQRKNVPMQKSFLREPGFTRS